MAKRSPLPNTTGNNLLTSNLDGFKSARTPTDFKSKGLELEKIDDIERPDSS